jgi:23S rRNA pseudouridine2457 synthase
MYSYYIIYKPYGYLSQFTKGKDQKKLKVLGDLHPFPKDCYSVGRLDTDSEGLLIITNDKKLNDLLLNPKNAHERTYWVQTDGDIKPDAINELCNGVEISIDSTPYFTRKAKAKKIEEPLNLPVRVPSVRVRVNIPTSWVELKLIEGKNRQVRRMTAKVGHPTLRLLRYAMEDLTLPEFKIGGVWEMDRETVYKKLNLVG